MDKNLVKNSFITIAVIIVLVLLFFIFFEKVEHKITIYPSDEARRNPFLAAERFLKFTGVKTKSINEKEVLINLPSTDHLIFINKMGGNIPKEREDILVNWINQGGELIITHDKFFDEKLNKSGNNFLDRFGIKLVDAKSLKDKKYKKNDNSGFNFDLPTNKKEIVEIGFNEDEPAKVEFIANRILVDENENADIAFQGESGNHILIFKLKKGRLIVFSDNLFLKNKEIDKNDHAYFLSQITKDKNKVWILYASNMPSLFRILYKNFPWFCFTFIILIVLSILRLSLKSGPVYQYRDTGIKNLIEHLDAAGEFQWRYDKANEMINLVRSSIEKELTKRHIYLSGKDEDKKFEIIAKMSGLTFEDIYRAFKEKIYKPEDLINCTKILKQVHFEILNKK